MPERLTCKGGGLLMEAVREAAALTTSYVTADSVYIEGADNIGLLVSFTKGSSSGCRLRVEFSWDDTNWFREPNYTTSGDDEIYQPINKKLESSMDIVISFPVANKYMRISGIAIDNATGTSLSIVAVLSNL